MNINVIDFPLPDDYRKLFSEIIDKATEQKTLTGHWQFFVSGNLSVNIGDVGIDLPSVKGNPFFSFNSLGFIDIFGDEQQSFVLLPLAFEWNRIQKMNRIQKFFARLPDNIKDPMIVISFVLSLLLTIITIIQSIKK